MGAISVTENWQERTVRVGSSGRTAMRVFEVIFDRTDEPVARPILALTAQDPDTKLSIPQRGSQHPFDSNMYVRDISVEPFEGPLSFRVTCSYSSLGTGGSQGAGSPLEAEPEVRWGFAVTSEQCDRAIARVESGGRIENIAITNSANQSFDPPISKDIFDLTLRFVRNEENFNPADALNYIGHVNSGTFFGAEAGMVMCTAIEAEKIYDDEFGDYYRVTYEFQFRLEEVLGKKYGWLRRILDEGQYEKVGENADGTDQYEPVRDEDSQAMVVPIKLDGDGGIKKADVEDVFLVYQLYPEADFSSLNIE